jgi:hypothetical protein
VDSITSDGRKALIAVGGFKANVRLFVVDTESGLREELPSQWFLPDSDPYAWLGRLVSIYTENTTSFAADDRMIVTVYN